MRLQNGFVHCSTRSATRMARAFKSARFHRGRRWCRLWWPKFTDQTLLVRPGCPTDQVDFPTHPGVVDTDWYVEDPEPRLIMRVDEVKAAQHGIAVSDVTHALALALSGDQVGLMHDQTSRDLCLQLSSLTARIVPPSKVWRIFACRAPTAAWFLCASWLSSNTRPSSPASITRICAAWCMSRETWLGRWKARLRHSEDE